MPILVIVILLIGGCSLLGRCGNDELKSCIDRGRVAMRENGSYPVFSDGRDAETVIGEHCLRTTGAY